MQSYLEVGFIKVLDVKPIVWGWLVSFLSLLHTVSTATASTSPPKIWISQHQLGKSFTNKHECYALEGISWTAEESNVTFRNRICDIVPLHGHRNHQSQMLDGALPFFHRGFLLGGKCFCHLCQQEEATLPRGRGNVLTVSRQSWFLTVLVRMLFLMT